MEVGDQRGVDEPWADTVYPYAALGKWRGLQQGKDLRALFGESVAAIGDRMEQVGLRLHPDKTKVVYCQDGKRRLDRELTAFTLRTWDV